MQSFINFLSEYAVIIGVILLAVAILVRLLRKRAARREAERWLAKARETITNDRKSAGLPHIPSGHIKVEIGDFDTAREIYVANPSTLLKELKKLNAGLSTVGSGKCTCNPEWGLTIRGYCGQATLPNCARLNAPVSDRDLTATINALSAGGLNSEGLTDGYIVKMARDLIRKADDDNTRRPAYTLDCRYIGAVLQQYDHGNRIVVRRGRNPARETSEEAMQDAIALLADLEKGTFDNAFITAEDRFNRRPEGRLTAIVTHGDTVTVT